MLGYRSFFRFRDEPRAEEALNGQLFRWLTSKSWDAATLVEGSTQRIASNVTGTLVRADADGAQSTRFVFDQDEQSGTWTTTVTLHVGAGGESGWVWFDIDNPESGPRAKPPRVAGELLRSVTGRDGHHVLTGEAAIARRAQADEILHAITDPQRRGLLFLAGTSDELPLDEWTRYVRGILHDTVGLASAHVLDAEATALLNAELPASHRIAPGTVRTFRPGVDLDDPVDGVRHRYLTTERIVRDRSYVLRRLLAHQARDLSTTAPLPHDALTIDELLRTRLDEALLDDAAPATRHAADTGDSAARLTEPAPSDPRGIGDALPPAPTTLGDRDLTALLSSVLREALGSSDVTGDAVRALGDIAVKARTMANARDSLQERIRRIEAERTEAQDEAELQRLLLEDEQLDRAQAEMDRAEAERRLRHLQKALARSGQAEVAWAIPEPAPDDVVPGSFDELLDRITTLSYIRFTGDPAITHDLDKHDDLGTWAGKTWEALLAADDYCRLIVTGKARCNLHQYLQDTPNGCHAFPATAHVPVESPTVRNTPKFHNARVFTVPETVDSDGSAFMGAHFKISRYRTVSPRMHYYDDAAGTGRIYIGYIGPHLPNTRTS